MTPGKQTQGMSTVRPSPVITQSSTHQGIQTDSLLLRAAVASCPPMEQASPQQLTERRSVLTSSKAQSGDSNGVPAAPAVAADERVPQWAPVSAGYQCRCRCWLPAGCCHCCCCCRHRGCPSCCARCCCWEAATCVRQTCRSRSAAAQWSCACLGHPGRSVRWCASRSLQTTAQHMNGDGNAMCVCVCLGATCVPRGVPGCRWRH